MATRRELVAATVEFKLDSAQMRELEEELAYIKDGVPKAIVGAINKTVAKGKTSAVDELYAILNLKSKEPLRKRILAPRATVAKMRGAVVLSTFRMGLENFDAKDTRIRSEKRDKKSGKLISQKRRKSPGRGVTVQTDRIGAAEIYPQAFMARYRGKVRVIQRKTVGDEGEGTMRRVLVPRLPIIPLVGPSPARAFLEHDDAAKKIEDGITEDFPEQILSQIDRLLGRKKSQR